MVPIMAFYTLLPCMSQAAPAEYKSVQSAKSICHDAYHGADSIQPTNTITYFYNGNTLINAEDDNGNMSTYLDRTVRTIVNVNTQTVEKTQCLFTDGKSVVSQTDSTGTNITSTQQYNSFGQPVSYTSSTNKQINKLTNQQLNILTNPFQYDGYYYDQESGLYYLNARYYSSTLMQFISMDTYDLANRYAYCDGNPIGNIDPTGHNVWSNILNTLNNKIVMDIADGVGILGSLASFDIPMFMTSAADLINNNAGIYSDKNYINDAISTVNLFQFGEDAFRIGRGIYRNNVKNFFSNKTKGTIFVDIDKNLIFNKASKIGKQGGKIPSAFTEENKLDLPAGSHDKYIDNINVYFNKRLATKLKDWQRSGYTIRGLSTGKWTETGFNTFANQIDNDFKWDSWTSSTHDSDGGIGLNGVWGHFKYSSKIKSNLTITSKFNYMKKFKGPKLLLDDQPYHRWGARLAGGYAAGAYTNKMVETLEQF